MNRRRFIKALSAIAIASVLSYVGCLSIADGIAFAQNIPSGATGGLDLSVSSDNPAPGQLVTITANSYASDIYSAVLTWASAGKVIAHGAGVTSIQIKAPALGKQTVINVAAVMANGQTFNNIVTIKSGYVDMIMEPDGYVPPFFMGKVPVSYQNGVKIIAVPHIADSSGKEYDPSTLIYQWKFNDNVMQSDSGYGKQSMTFQGAIVPRTATIMVTVSTRDGSAQAQGIVSVPQSAPTTVVYQNDPLYGPMFNRALGSAAYIGTNRELSVIAIPYGFNGFSMGGSNGDITISWLINNISHPELDGNDTATLRAPSQGSGSSDIQLTVSNTKEFLQQASAEFSAIFSASATTSSNQLTF
ncbi:MAG: hypothetical protein KGI49_03410 [Patescibacteria group bacterium]|nr:hypothetical protein [Patescibacteria group bacterium]